MASLVAKKKGNKLYYYVVESARVDGKPRIVHQAYLGTAEKVADLVKDRTAPVPLSATMRDFGLPGALWLAAQQTGVFALLESLWPQPRSGPSPAHYLLLAAIHRIVSPVLRPRSPIGMTVPSCTRCGKSRPSASPHKPSGMPSSRFCRRNLPVTIRWRTPSCACWLYGSKSQA
jgi:hypothetical protein